ncbi:MAG: hypothetical protein NTU47_16410 [Ignavibacteriales bacterium]|nr:hypothetical protein [Ignavibacteriales bacterium]
MKTIGIILAAAVLIGCRHPYDLDITPPSPPQGIRAVALNNAVELSWLRNPEPDVAGYKIWVSDRYDGKYQVLGSVVGISFIDNGATNGTRAYYGVTAYDFDGNESELSTDLVYATPRPEGFGTKLSDYHTSPKLAGYDFSTYSVGDYNDDFTDVFFESSNGRYYLNVWDDTEVQDMGYTKSLYEIAVAPSGGWSPSRSVEAIAGHTYVLWTWDDHFAKIRVREVTAFRVTFDWAYQVAGSNPELKRELPPDGLRRLHVRSAALTWK